MLIGHFSSDYYFFELGRSLKILSQIIFTTSITIPSTGKCRLSMVCTVKHFHMTNTRLLSCDDEQRAVRRIIGGRPKGIPPRRTTKSNPPTEDSTKVFKLTTSLPETVPTLITTRLRNVNNETFNFTSTPSSYTTHRNILGNQHNETQNKSTDPLLSKSTETISKDLSTVPTTFGSTSSSTSTVTTTSQMPTPIYSDGTTTSIVRDTTDPDIQGPDTTLQASDITRSTRPILDLTTESSQSTTTEEAPSPDTTEGNSFISVHVPPTEDNRNETSDSFSNDESTSESVLSTTESPKQQNLPSTTKNPNIRKEVLKSESGEEYHVYVDANPEWNEFHEFIDEDAEDIDYNYEEYVNVPEYYPDDYYEESETKPAVVYKEKPKVNLATKKVNKEAEWFVEENRKDRPIMMANSDGDSSNENIEIRTKGQVGPK